MSEYNEISTDLILNVLNEETYETNIREENELYLVTDDKSYVTTEMIVDGAVTPEKLSETYLTRESFDEDLNEIFNDKQDKIVANGILKADGNNNISAARAGIDYTTPEQLLLKQNKITANGILKCDGEGNISTAQMGTDYASVSQVNTKQNKITVTGILKGNGTSVTKAEAGIDYPTIAQVNAKQNKLSYGTVEPAVYFSNQGITPTNGTFYFKIL